MASAEKPTELSEAAMNSQLQEAKLWEEATDNLCPICLNEIKNPSYISICFHIFCLSCIQRWMYVNGVCPVCRQPFDCILHTVRADDDYQEYKVGASNSQRGRVGKWRECRTRQHHYFLRPRAAKREPTAETRRPRERQ